MSDLVRIGNLLGQISVPRELPDPLQSSRAAMIWADCWWIGTTRSEGWYHSLVHIAGTDQWMLSVWEVFPVEDEGEAEVETESRYDPFGVRGEGNEPEEGSAPAPE